jgi:hypothetical protein
MPKHLFPLENPDKTRTKPGHFCECHFSEALFGETRPKPDRFQTEKMGGAACFVSIGVDWWLASHESE